MIDAYRFELTVRRRDVLDWLDTIHMKKPLAWNFFPVGDVTVTEDGQLKQASAGSGLPPAAHALAVQIKRAKLTEITPKQIKEMMTMAGLSQKSYPYAMTSLQKTKVIKRAGTGRYKVL